MCTSGPVWPNLANLTGRQWNLFLTACFLLMAQSESGCTDNVFNSGELSLPEVGLVSGSTDLSTFAACMCAHAQLSAPVLLFLQDGLRWPVGRGFTPEPRPWHTNVSCGFACDSAHSGSNHHQNALHACAESLSLGYHPALPGAYIPRQKSEKDRKKGLILGR